jgi:TolA-binding protein
MGVSIRVGIAVFAAAAATVIFSPCAPGEEIASSQDPAVKLELQYAQALNEWGLPEYAEMVIKGIDLNKHPEAVSLLKVLQLQGLIMRGKWDDVKAAIAREPDQNSQEVWAMRLAMADGYYAWGRYKEAQQLYNSFFTAYPDGPSPALNAFYTDSAYKYAQLLLLMNNRKEALRAYHLVRKAKLEQHIERQVMGETAELLVKLAEETKDEAERKKFYQEIDEILNKILWVQDLWFGKGIVIMAHVKMLQDDPDGATKLVAEFGKQLEEIDNILKQQEEETKEPLSRLSPMAQCRYLVGCIRQEQAEKILADPEGDKPRAISLLAGDAVAGGKQRAKNGAIHEFYRVFLNYPNTAWASDAGKRAKKIEDTLINDLGAQVKSSITPEKMAQVRDSQFQSARVVFNQQQFEKAAESYLDVLNEFPEVEPSLPALSDLVRCYTEIGDSLFTETVMRYIAERFSANKDTMLRAGDDILRLAFSFDEQQRTADRDAANELFFEFFRDHPRTPGLLLKFGADQMEAANYNAALAYFMQVETNYPASDFVVDALGREAACYSRMNDVSNELAVLRDKYIPRLEKNEKPGHALVAAKYRVASAYRKLDDANRAYVQYKEITDWLTEKPQQYQISEEEQKANKTILEASLYYKAAGFAKMTPPKDKDESFLRLLSIQSFLKLVELFPKSSFAPAALSQVGTLYTVMDKAQEAEDTLKRLQKEYPDSEEAKNSYFMLGMNLLKLGQRTRAISVLKEMFSDKSGRYTPAQILAAGQILLEQNEAEIALEAFDRILSGGEKQRGIVEPAAVGKGKAEVFLKRWDAAVKTLEDVMLKFPRSGYTVDVCRMLSQSYSELARKEVDQNTRISIFNEAIDAMQKARKFEKEPGGRALLDVETARIMARKMEAEIQHGTPERAATFRGEAVAAYQGLMMFGKADDPSVRPHMEDAFNECVPLLLQMKKPQDAMEDCDKYVELFPRGKWILNIRNYRNQAKIDLVSSGAVIETGGGNARPPEEAK